MKKYPLLFVVFLLTSFTTPILAETFSYTGIAISYDLVTQEIDGISEDYEGDGISFGFSIGITPNIAFLAGYGAGTVDVTSGGNTAEADIESQSIGVNFHSPINDTADFVAGIRLIQANIDLKLNNTLVSSEDGDGNSIRVGIRAMAAKNLELNGFIDRSDIEDSTDTDIEFGAEFYLDKLVALTVDYSFDSDGNSLSFGAKKYF